MKKNSYFTCLRGLAVGLACLAAGSFAASAKTIVHNGVVYTVSKSNVTIAKSNTTTGVYTGEIEIPETFEEGGITYTVVGIDMNAFKNSTVTKVTLPKTCVKIGANAFNGCTELTNYPIPEEVTSFGNGAFNGCSKITEAFIPAGVTGALISNQFAKCSSLKKLTFRSSTETLKLTNGMWGGDSTQWYPPIEEIVIGRNLSYDGYKSNQNPLRGYKTLTKVTFDGEATAIYGEMFASCQVLSTVDIKDSKITSIGAQAFKSCPALTSIVLPAAVAEVSSSVFADCSALANVQLGNVTTIADYAFSNCKALKSLSLPETLNTIQSNAFINSGLEGVVTLPSALTSVGTSAYAGTNITGVALPASITTIGNAAFAPVSTLASITLADGNANFKVENGVLTTADGKRLLVTAHQGINFDNFNNSTVESVDNYGLAFSPYETVILPNVTSFGNYAFYKAAVKSFTLYSKATTGSNMFNGSALKNLVIEDGRNEIPQGLCDGCQELSDVAFSNTTTNVMKNAFANCPKLETMTIPASVNYMEAGSVPSTIKTLKVLNVNVPVLAANVFNADQKAVKCYVATNAVEAYNNANQWSYLDIEGDASISGKAATLGCPTGLYFATKDGKLMYKDATGTVVDTKFATGDHAFNLASYKNRVYVAVAGTNFRYQYPTAGAGDGELFYVNRTGDIFYRVTVLNNVGYEAFQDPFSMTIVPSDNKIYIADRNVGIHEMDADTVGLYGEQPFFFKNDWLPYYGNPWAYGAIGAGFAMDSTNVYWVAKKFSGLGIFRFKKSDIYTAEEAKKHNPPYKTVLPDDQLTSFYMDEANGYLYFFLQKGASVSGYVPGVYRLPLQAIKDADAADESVTLAAATLIDNSPVLLEGSGDEITGVCQISGDENNVYWSYIAPMTEADATAAGNKDLSVSVPGSIELDTTNPLHHSGIKYVAAKGDDLTVKFAVEGVEAYGVVPATFVPSDPTDVKTVVADTKAVVKAGNVVVPADALVSIYSINGSLVASQKVAAGAAVNISSVAKGIYIVRIAYANGAKETVKVIR